MTGPPGPRKDTVTRRARWQMTLAAALCASALAAAARLTSAVPDVLPDAARLVARNLPRMHISHRDCSDQMAAAALDIYLDSLDYDHSYFLASDIAAFRKDASNLDDCLRSGDLSFAYRVQDVLRERVSNRVAYADALLARGFDLSPKETFHWKRDEAPWPADEAEWDELWRRKIKNQYLARVVARTLGAESDAEAEKKLLQGGDEEEKTATEEAEAKLAPEEFVRKGYRQYLTLLNDTDPETTAERFLSAFARAYDPHSDYMSRNSAEDFDISMKLSLFGIGALLTTEDGMVKVDRIIPGSPAARDGRLKAGDRIIAVAQGDTEAVDILHWPLTRAVRLIRGAKGTKVVLTVLPASDLSGATVRKIDLIRDEVKLEEQAAKGDVREVRGADGNVRRLGVIKVPEFYADLSARRAAGREPRTVSGDVRHILGELATNRIEGIILDLRNNSGGPLNEAVELTGLFIDSGPVVQVSDGYGSQVLGDTDPVTVYGGPLVVLVNRQAASASEILAGALQDYGRAVIVGDSKTHGKGTIQTLAPLKAVNPALGQLKVTTASFYRIDGGSTQLKGVTPDIVIPSVLDSLELGEEFLPHALPWSVVYPALYRPVADLRGVIPQLRRRSEERRQKDARFAAYGSLLDRLAERQKSQEISLNLDERLAQVRSEQELQKSLEAEEARGDESANAPKNGKDEAKKKDLLLDEALNILSDLVALEKEPKPSLAQSER